MKIKDIDVTDIKKILINHFREEETKQDKKYFLDEIQRVINNLFERLGK